jgi:hypothetical protein
MAQQNSPCADAQRASRQYMLARDGNIVHEKAPSSN